MLRRTTGYGFTPDSGRFKAARVAVLGSFRGVWGYKNTTLGPCLLHFTPTSSTPWDMSHVGSEWTKKILVICPTKTKYNG